MEDVASPKRLFLVDGKTDEKIVSSILEKLHISSENCVDCGGIDNLLNELTARIKASKVRSIGIIVDANNSLKKKLAVNPG